MNLWSMGNGIQLRITLVCHRRGSSGKNVKLNDLKLRLNRRFLSSYDLTAQWEFEIRLLKILPVDSKKPIQAVSPVLVPLLMKNVAVHLNLIGSKTNGHIVPMK